MICRLILADWVKKADLSRVLEGGFSEKDIQYYNSIGYNCYYLPNYPERYEKGTRLDGAQINVWSFVFVDYDLKDKVYASKEDFIAKIAESNLPPSSIVDSGHGIHIYWKIKDLDAMSYLRFQKRLIQEFKTDRSVSTLFQLMRVPGTMNVKVESHPVVCEILYEDTIEYTCDELNKLLPPISFQDEIACKDHFNNVMKVQPEAEIDDKMPAKFAKLLEKDDEIRSLFTSMSGDRSAKDWRLVNKLKLNGLTRDEAITVIAHTAKAVNRNPVQRVKYAQDTVDKLWTEDSLDLSKTVDEYLQQEDQSGQRLRCHTLVDGTHHGFRCGKVLGLVAGSGVGKTAFTLQFFKWFIELNPGFDHFFVSLEQPGKEIAQRWNVLCEGNKALNSKVHIIDNYNQDESFRHLSLEEIKKYISDWKKRTGKKVGCVVIDHIAILKTTLPGSVGIETICHKMKPFAKELDCFLIMQSQTTKEKAGIGDKELNKDAAYGTIMFEAFCDYLVTLWQPLKTLHHNPDCPTVSAFKFCKIRHKNQRKDRILEDVVYRLLFDPDTETFRQLNQLEEEAFTRYFSILDANKRDTNYSPEYHAIPEEHTNEPRSNRLTTRH